MQGSTPPTKHPLPTRRHALRTPLPCPRPDCFDNPDDYELADLCPLDYGGTGDGCQPPNLITTLINIALAPGSVDEPLYAGQATVQTVILLAAFGSVPVLLLGKPYFISRQMKQKHESDSRVALTSGGEFGDEYHKGLEEEGGHGEGGDDHEDHDFSEIVIHQAIETIEFVLGMVSNTASYLRLWALSLAHSELATVFWEKAMLSTIEMGNPVAIFVGYSVFAGVTFAVLLCMDVLGKPRGCRAMCPVQPQPARHPPTHSPTHSLTHPPTYSLTHSNDYPPTHPPTRVLPPRASPPLGRVPEQVLQGRRI